MEPQLKGWDRQNICTMYICTKQERLWRMMGNKDYMYEYVYVKNWFLVGNANIYSFSNSSPKQKLISHWCRTCMTVEVKHHSAALMTSNTLCFLQLLLRDAWSHCLIWIQVLSVVTDIQISVRTCKAWTWSVGGTTQKKCIKLK